MKFGRKLVIIYLIKIQVGATQIFTLGRNGSHFEKWPPIAIVLMLFELAPWSSSSVLHELQY